MSTTPKKSFAEIMKTVQATGARAEATLSICLSPDLSQKLAELEYDIEEARDREQAERESRSDKDSPSSNRRVGDDEDTLAELEAKREKMVDDNLDVFYDMLLQAARMDEWADLRAEHPAKEDVEDDEIGVHWVTFVPAAVRKCVVDPEPTDEVLAFLNESLTPGEWNRLGFAILRLNGTVRDRPKSRRNTSTTTNSDDVSE